MVRDMSERLTIDLGPMDALRDQPLPTRAKAKVSLTTLNPICNISGPGLGMIFTISAAGWETAQIYQVTTYRNCRYTPGHNIQEMLSVLRRSY